MVLKLIPGQQLRAKNIPECNAQSCLIQTNGFLITMLSLPLQIKSDKVSLGEVIYKLEGPGVNQEPKDLFEIDEKTGWIKSKMPLDREKYKSFTVNAKHLKLITLISDSLRK